METHDLIGQQSLSIADLKSNLIRNYNLAIPLNHDTEIYQNDKYIVLTLKNKYVQIYKIDDDRELALIKHIFIDS